ncbi:MAG: PaaI family thioesterase [Pararhodobacter sp.]|nr:PaaI family thioesterase [Pararhodobacter sp.]
MKQEQFINADRFAITRAIAEGRSDVALETSPLLRALKCRFLTGVPGRLTIGFEPGPDHLQGHGVVCGGIIATMLDFALAFATLSRLGSGDSAVSVALNVSYLGAVQPEPVRVTAEVVTMGYRLAQARAELIDAGGKLLATAQSPLALQRGNPG